LLKTTNFLLCSCEYGIQYNFTWWFWCWNTSSQQHQKQDNLERIHRPFSKTVCKEISAIKIFYLYSCCCHLSLCH